MKNANQAEESGGGKIILLKRGGYADMDACIMYYDNPLNFPAMRTSSHLFFPRCHPDPFLPNSSRVGTSIAMQQIDVEYFGHRFVQYRS